MDSKNFQDASMNISKPTPDLSIIVPLYNEEDSVGPMYDAIKAAIDGAGHHYEIIFVDDGSRDRTFERAREKAQQDPWLRVIRFRKNYGQTPAMAAGIDHARGRILVTMDGDLQNDPTDIPHFLAKINEGYDIVVGWRHQRQDKLITRKIPSRVANWIIGKVTRVPIRDNGCSLKAYRARVIQNIPLYNEMHRFIPAMTSLAGTKVAEIKVKHHARQFGTSKYGLSRIYKVMLDLLTIRTLLSIIRVGPIRVFGMIALIFALFVPLLTAITLLRWLWATGPVYKIFPGLILLFTCSAIFLLCLGVLCELIYRFGTIKPSDVSLLTSNIDRYAATAYEVTE
jgi:glycosyltransferase involved in cell wall biosynthesis